MTGSSANQPLRRQASPAEATTDWSDGHEDAPVGRDLQRHVAQANRDSARISVPQLDAAARLIRTRH